MTGILVTGHGSFATGIMSGVYLIAGEPQCCKAVDFLPDDSLEHLTKKLETALDSMKEADSILILTDIAGGSPFNVSCRLKLTREEIIEVLGGVSLPVLLEVCMSRDSAENADQLAAIASEVGKTALVHYEQTLDDAGEDYEE